MARRFRLNHKIIFPFNISVLGRYDFMEWFPLGSYGHKRDFFRKEVFESKYLFPTMISLILINRPYPEPEFGGQRTPLKMLHENVSPVELSTKCLFITRWFSAFIAVVSQSCNKKRKVSVPKYSISRQLMLCN